MTYNGEEFELNDDFIDVGYMAENVEVTDFYGEKCELKRSHEDKSMTLFISFPNDSDMFAKEALIIDDFMKDIQVPINCHFIFSPNVSANMALKNRLEKFKIYFDCEDEFGGMYGTQIVSGTLEGMLTKALFLISKDGAIFYLDMPDDISKPLDSERLKVELNKAYVSYTGVGCH
jgi:peroxiredoxin